MVFPKKNDGFSYEISMDFPHPFSHGNFPPSHPPSRPRMIQYVESQNLLGRKKLAASPRVPVSAGTMRRKAKTCPKKRRRTAGEMGFIYESMAFDGSLMAFKMFCEWGFID